MQNAYMHTSSHKSGKDHKSRNSGIAQNNSGGSLPKWQSLNNNLVSTTKMSSGGPQVDHAASFEFSNQAQTTSHGVKKRKSTNV